MHRRILAQAILGHGVHWPATSGANTVAALHLCAEREGVHALLSTALADVPGAHPLTSQLRDALRLSMRREALEDLTREHALRALFSELVAAGVRFLVLKGGALAYSHYEESYHRPRCDTDLLVAPEEVERTESILEAAGYQRRAGVSGRLLSYESTWVDEGAPAAAMQIDLHWRVSNIQGFARALSFDELHAERRELDAFGSIASAPGDIHAFVIGAMHLIGNDRWGLGRRLIWLWDLLLLGRSFSLEAWSRVGALAQDRGLTAVVREATQRVRQEVDVQLPDVPGDHPTAPDAPGEVTAAYIGAGHTRALLTDLRSLPTWTDRFCLLQEHAFPPADYMRWRFGVDSRTPVTSLHLRRLLGVAPRGSRT